jgi:GNAT superfamily N-acetyltransferase
MTAGSVERTLITTPPPQRGAGSGLIRSGSPADADMIRDFVCGLSPRSQYYRFFASVCPPTTGLLRALSGATGSADILVVTDSKGAMIGHAMAADARQAGGRLETNIGLVVGDEWQRRGLGTTLLRMLVGRASRRGVNALVLDVLPENETMRGIIRRRWPDAGIERTRDALIFRPLIGPADAGYPFRLPAAIDLPGLGRHAEIHAGGVRAPNRSAA